MSSPINSAVEVGLRSLMILNASYPQDYDLDSLLLLDHGLLHSADLGGPPSLHPGVPMRVAEIGAKRSVMEEGLRVMLRAQLVEIQLSAAGVRYKATANANGFIDLLETDYSAMLRSRAEWVARELAINGPEALRNRTRSTINSGLEQIMAVPQSPDEEV